MAPTFISPDGNPEVWKTKPIGYFTVAEWEAIHAPAPLSLTFKEVQERALMNLADFRWRIETSGIIVNGMVIPTDRESQSLITGAVARTTLDPSIIIRWKTASIGENGAPIFISLNAQMIGFIGQAVGDHVQACFDLEEIKSLEIVALKTIAAIENWEKTQLNVGWPASDKGYFT